MSANKQKHINLLPVEDFERTTLGRIMKWALTSFRFIVIIVEFIVISGFLFRFWLDVRISDLDDEITQKSALISSRSDFEESFRKVQNKTVIYNQITEESNLSLPYFQNVIKSLPADSQIISLTRKGSTIDLTGASVSENSISSFIANLKSTDSFSTVSLSEISTKLGSPLVEFRLNLTLNKPV